MLAYMKKILVNFWNTFIQTFLSGIESYKVGAYYIFPTYHCCQYRNRNGTRKEYNTIKEKCVLVLFILLVGEKPKRNIWIQKLIILDIKETLSKLNSKKKGLFYHKNVLTNLYLNWSKIMNIINYFAEWLYVKIVLNSAEIAVLKVCYYCKNCKNCKRFYSIKTELEKRIFLHLANILNIGILEIQNLTKSIENFDARAIRDPTFKM